MTGQADSAADRKPFVGAIYPEDLPPLLPESTARNWLHRNQVRAYGWADGGFTYSSSGYGQLAPAPIPNRFGNQFLVNGIWLIVDRPTAKRGWSWGFRSDFYAGADAALLRPMNSFGPGSTHFGTDFRQAYIALHTPGVNHRGIDWSLGRQNVPTGYETLMGPYRPMYSETHFWIRYEVGSTSALATLHPTAKLDVIGGVVLGYNTVFELRGRSPSYVGRVLYRPTGEKTTQFIATVYTGPQPFAATAGHVGTWQTLGEVQVRQTWTPRIFQVLQAHYAADVGDPAIGNRNASTQGAFAITAFKVDPKLYINTRLEWFSDPHGVRSGHAGSYGAATLGINYLPLSFVNFRPEIRGDFAGDQAFTASRGRGPVSNQLTVGFDVIFKFDVLK
jgi:hypothetical protein